MNNSPIQSVIPSDSDTENTSVGTNQDDIQDCSICWNTLDARVAETDCNHKFHTKCLTTWARKNPTCPICRASLVEDFVSSKAYGDFIQIPFAFRNPIHMILFPLSIFLLLIGFAQDILKLCLTQLFLLFILALHIFFFFAKVILSIALIVISCRVIDKIFIKWIQ